jgi:hypothetical protein
MRWLRDGDDPGDGAAGGPGRTMMAEAEEGGPTGGVYFEFTPIGTSVKVAAIDAATGLEVSVIGPARASQADLQQLALQKLKARLKAGR